MRVLLIEDSEELAVTLSSILQEEMHYMVDIAPDGQKGYDAASSGIYDIAILDLMLPKISGEVVLRRLRQDGNGIPVLVLSAKSELEDKIQAFTLGADDYLTKPFEPQELMMRIMAICRRKGAIMADRILSLGNLELDLDKCHIRNRDSGKTVKLSKKEFHLMEYLLSNPEQVLRREQIIQKVWGYDSEAEYNNLEVYLSFLRKKLSFIDVSVKIQSTRGVGYSLEVC